MSQFDPHEPRSVRRLPSGNARGGGVDGGGYGAVAHDRRVAGDREASVGGPRWAQGARGAIHRGADAGRSALLTEIAVCPEGAPAVDPSTTRRHRRRSSDARRAFRRRSHRGDRRVRRAGPFASSGDGSGRWRARRRGRSRSGAPRAGVPRRAGSRHERHAPSTRARLHDYRWRATRRTRATAPEAPPTSPPPFAFPAGRRRSARRRRRAKSY